MTGSSQSALFQDPLIQFGLERMDREIIDLFSRDDPETLELILPLIRRPGKRLRPVLALLSASASGCSDERSFKYAAVIELIHSASLFHDDVLDNASLRRGLPSANQLIGNHLAILVGDFLYSKAISLMIRDKKACQAAVNATVIAMTEGEIVQLRNQHTDSGSIERYYWIIERKTARLMELACFLGASACGTPQEIRALAQYGKHLGLAFQIIDDLLDWIGGEEDLGKKIFQDVRDGRITLPALLLIEALDPESSKEFLTLIQSGTGPDLDAKLVWYQSRMKDFQIDRQVRAEAKKQSDLAVKNLERIKPSHERLLLERLPDILIDRIR